MQPDRSTLGCHCWHRSGVPGLTFAVGLGLMDEVAFGAAGNADSGTAGDGDGDGDSEAVATGSGSGEVVAGAEGSPLTAVVATLAGPAATSAPITTAAEPTPTATRPRLLIT